MDNRHAYLIMAHDNPCQLSKLIHLLDDERNDIFVHIDKKSESFPMEIFDSLVQKSILKVIMRKKCFWAEYSQVDIELDLLEAAMQQGDYRYCHLLSGHDLPLKTQNQIHDFFDNHSEEFITVIGREKLLRRQEYFARYTRYRHPLLKINNFRNSKTLKIFDELLVWIQVLFRMNVQNARNTKHWVFRDGWTWFSITKEFANYILSQRSYIQNIFQDAKAPDEFLMATLAYNSAFFKQLYPKEKETGYGSMRYIDWNRGKPYNFQKEDFSRLISSNCMFARKFDETIDNDIIEQIYQYLEE